MCHRLQKIMISRNLSLISILKSKINKSKKKSYDDRQPYIKVSTLLKQNTQVIVTDNLWQLIETAGFKISILK